MILQRCPVSLSRQRWLQPLDHQAAALRSARLDPGWQAHALFKRSQWLARHLGDWNFRGKAQGAPELIKANVNPNSLGLTRSGALYYSAVASGRYVYVASIDPESGKLVSAPTPVAQPYLLNDFPRWSAALLSSMERNGLQALFRSTRMGVRSLFRWVNARSRFGQWRTSCPPSPQRSEGPLLFAAVGIPSRPSGSRSGVGCFLTSCVPEGGGGRTSYPSRSLYDRRHRGPGS